MFNNIDLGELMFCLVILIGICQFIAVIAVAIPAWGLQGAIIVSIIFLLIFIPIYIAISKIFL